MSKKIIIVGAGIAGLTAGIYAKRSGFDVTLIEQHSIVGGMCTSWKRKGYFFEGNVHWLTGSSPKTNMYKIWKDTGALSDKVKVIYSNPFTGVEWDGQIIDLYRDFDKTTAHLIAVSPDDEKLLKQLNKDVKMLCRMEMPVSDIKGLKTENPMRISLGSLFKMMPAFSTMKRLNSISIKDFTNQFKHPALRQIFNLFVPDDYSASSMAFTLASLHSGDGGYPEGGSLPMVQRMSETFTNAGGKLLLNTKVKKVIIEEGKVSGVMLDNETLKADAVIVTQETIAALNQLFDIPLHDTWLKEIAETTRSVACTFIGVGVRAEIPLTHEWKLAEPIKYADKVINELSFWNYSGYEGFAPDGGTVLTTAMLGDTYDFWAKAQKEGRYEAEKQALADQIKHAIETKFPQAKDKIEVIDVATPLTYERYTGAHHGSWMSSIGAGEKMKSYTGEVESISGLYFAGHRLNMPGGLPAAAVSGRTAAQLICRKFDTVFR